ncbi:hypothetical protein [Oerskovia sp. KBS0722]|uniref:hypothetical protein n=1 Tax=Oerskovia sp. KBS0722 TaxID=1179673 RepID=UPI00110DCA1E|nr:hypothetical protein [Oerskovia sp. KBS0722]QDW62327.1 hypothetical protein FFI11_007085 [Oerskovia sp. KBS0722]
MSDQIGYLHRTDWVADRAATMSNLAAWLGPKAAIAVPFDPALLEENGADLEVVDEIRALFPQVPVASLEQIARYDLPAVAVVHPMRTEPLLLRTGGLPAGKLAVVLWRPDEPIAHWAVEMSVIDLAHPKQVPAPVAGFDVLVEGVRTIKRREGHNGISSGRGRNLSVQVLQHLQRAGYPIRPALVERAGFRAGMGVDAIEHLGGYARQLIAGHNFRTGPAVLRPEIVAIWEREAADADTDDEDLS